jgi:aryl-alcohol dehydrogenase-like predicted oxidoreductase
LREGLTHSARNAAVAELEKLAAEIHATPAQLAIAWCTKNPRVSTVITGASKVAQLQDNLGAVDVAARLTPELMQRIEALTGALAD